MASLMSAGDVMVQYDQAYERYDMPEPQLLAAGPVQTPPGLSDPVSFGTPRPNVSPIPHFDEEDLARPPNQGWPAPLVVLHRGRPAARSCGPSRRRRRWWWPATPRARQRRRRSGSSTRQPDHLLRRHAGHRPAALQARRSGAPADLVVTDTNRKQAFRWDTLNANAGYTETPAEDPDTDRPERRPIDLFPGAPADAADHARLLGASSVTASSYGNSVSYIARGPACSALDGNSRPAWIDGTFVQPAGQWWQVALHQPVTDRLTSHLVQPQTGDPDRWITKVTLTFDGGTRSPYPWDRASRRERARRSLPVPDLQHPAPHHHGVGHRQRPTRPVGSRSSVGLRRGRDPRRVGNETVADAPGPAARGRAPASVGRPPHPGHDPPAQLGHAAAGRPRDHHGPQFTLPTARTFTLAGSARLSALVPDDEIDRLVGRRRLDHAGIVAVLARPPARRPASRRLATLDGNPDHRLAAGLRRRRTRSASGSVHLPATHHLRPPRPQDRGRRAPLGADRR